MHFEIPHQLGKEQAIQRIDRSIDQLRAEPLPAGVTVKDFAKTWTDNVLKVSFWAGKGFLGATISATATVEESLVAVDIELPPLLKAFVSDSKIEEGIRAKVTPLLE
jgi:hypothetical protein